MPVIHTVTAGPEWREFTFPLSAPDVTAIAFSGAEPGAFRFEIANVEVQ